LAERAKGLAWVALAYAVAIAAGYGVALQVTDLHPAAVMGVGYAVSVVAIFVFSRAFSNSSFFDAWWMVAPVTVLPWFIKGSGNDVREMIIAALVTAWAVRLTWNWIRGWRGLSQEDWRYLEMKKSSGRWYWLVSFTGIHAFPGFLVWLGSLSIVVAMPSRENLWWLDFVAIAVTASAIAIEAIADQQLHRFAQSSPPKGATCDVGLWKYSRHPNYFGEIGFWTGLFVFALAADLENGWYAIAGPLAMLGLFVFGTIPMMEKRQMERRPEAYAAYKKRVSMLVPLPPRS
jgi:steroid 5-alpha reductase family enzyme